MEFQSLESGRFLRRYKRFLADIELSTGQILTVHCPNTGAMTGCLEEGATAYYSDSKNPSRKYRHTLEWLTLSNGAKACINTQRPNQLVLEAIKNGCLKELQGYQAILTEKKYGKEGSRIDILLQNHTDNKANCYVEVKNVTLCEGNVGFFPDAISIRALKHIRELQGMVELGFRAAVVFCINHSRIQTLKPADKVQLDYGQLLRQAAAAGLELYAYQTDISAQEIKIVRPIPIDLTK